MGKKTQGLVRTDSMTILPAYLTKPIKAELTTTSKPLKSEAKMHESLLAACRLG